MKRDMLEWLAAQKRQSQYQAEREAKYGGNRQYVDKKIAEVKMIDRIEEIVETSDEE